MVNLQLVHPQIALKSYDKINAFMISYDFLSGDLVKFTAPTYKYYGLGIVLSHKTPYVDHMGRIDEGYYVVLTQNCGVKNGIYKAFMERIE